MVGVSKEWLQELFRLGISALLNPQVQFRPEHRRNVRVVKNALSKPPGEVHKLRRPIMRNSFLYACNELTKSEPVVHLIAGFGRRRGGGTDISAAYHIVGKEISVVAPQSLLDIVMTHAVKGSRSDTILFHNHPANWLDGILPKLPLSSFAEQKLMIEMNLSKKEGYNGL